MAQRIYAALFIVTLAIAIRCDKNSHHRDKQIPPKSYNKKERPFLHDDKVLNVSVHLWLESFGSVDVAKMEYDIFGYIIQRWEDERLVHSHKDLLLLNGPDINSVWVPDLYCINCRESDLTNGRNEKQSMMIISNDGSIYYSIGVKLKASCPLDLVNFPFDFQRCPLTLTSFSFNASNVSFEWHEIPTIHHRNLEQFEVIRSEISTKMETYASGNFTILQGTICLSRRIGFYVLQIYIPTIMLVFLSWSLFVMRTSTIGERMTIGVTLFLAMVFLHGYSNSSLPKVSYVKAVDWFIVASLGSVILLIIESILNDKLLGKPEITPFQANNKDGDKSDEINGCKYSSLNKGNPCQNCVDQFEIDVEEFMIEEGKPKTFNCTRIFQKAKRNVAKAEQKNLEAQTPLCCREIMQNSRTLHRMKNSRYDIIGMVLFPTFYLAFNVWYWIYFNSLRHG